MKLGRYQGVAPSTLLDLNIQVLSGPEIHDVDIEVVVGGLGQQLAQGEYLPGHRHKRLLAGPAMMRPGPALRHGVLSAISYPRPARQTFTTRAEGEFQVM